MLREFVTWWLQQMASLLPYGMGAGTRYRDAIVVRDEAGGLQASLRRRGVESSLGSLQPGGALLRRLRSRRSGPILLGLPAAALLQQTASLPIAAELDLAAVLRHEMDRLTPFVADDVYWSWRTESRDRAAGRLLLRLLLVPKAAVTASLERLRAAGLRPVALEAPVGGAAEYLPLQQSSGAGRGSRLAAWTCAVLLLALIAIPVIRQERAIATTEAEIARLRPRVAAVDTLRQRLAASQSGSGLFATEVQRVGTPLRALAALTTALPDDTYLLSLAMKQRMLTFSGRSASAAKLIGSLSAQPALRDPAFDAPVTRVSAGSDLFSIRVTLAP